MIAYYRAKKDREESLMNNCTNCLDSVKKGGINLPEIKDSGDRHEFASGAVRDMQEGKGRCDLLPPAAILRLARHFEAGARKYGERNWEKGIPIKSFIDSGLRHILKYMQGMDDEDHLVAAAWNLMCALEIEERFGWKFPGDENSGQTADNKATKKGQHE